MDFKQLLRYYVFDRNLNYTMLARRCRVSPSTITRTANGERHPSREIIINIARALRITPCERNFFVAKAGYLPESLDKIYWSQELEDAVTKVGVYA